MSQKTYAIKELNLTDLQAQRLVKQYSNIRYRANRIYRCSFEFGTFYDFVQWIKSQGGYKDRYHVARHRDKGSYSPANCRYVTHQENLKETAKVYLISNLETSEQIVSQNGLQILFLKEFGLKVAKHVYRYVNKDKLFMGKFKISALTLH